MSLLDRFWKWHNDAVATTGPTKCPACESTFERSTGVRAPIDGRLTCDDACAAELDRQTAW